ncbi:AAA family ATPase [Siphonobacter sp. SORGH_AS_1065]|uniref:AAA family ATPase n=1 Tax=Siphonobacter sp. SORGH_AS_1065 TaxID=3041795 RepID=UPI002788E089|nr:AAA family ATPase [Siphonobacter sp. SORGH_AS_1065]MDQ1090039.1 transitional endoplasmic reticulum ATPase [Siphonobacter sp. SORGH_AS_1065]
MNQSQLDALREALQFSPQNLPLRRMLADAYFQLARYEEALDEYKSALQLSADPDLKIKLAECYLQLSNYPTAHVIAEELLETNPSPQILFLLARISLASNDLQSANSYYKKATAQDHTLTQAEFESQLNQAIRESGQAQTSAFQEEIDRIEAEGSGLVEKPRVTFAEVGGLSAVKEEIALKVIHPINNPEIYKAFGKKIGGGILLYGPPGCGKTLLARATAGEIKANFISVGINDVLDMWMGNSEKNLHDLFQQARMNTPCVLFFDEVDALGASRTDLRKAAGRTLINQFLDELDGVKYSNEGILILGATNTPWYLDTAFRRPGRFDRIVFVTPPDAEARMDILKILMEDKPTEGIDYTHIAKQSDGYSGADLRALVDIAVEQKLPESLRLGKVLPLTTSDFKEALKKHRPTTKEWFATAKNYALYSNESGLYDDILKYLKLK